LHAKFGSLFRVFVPIREEFFIGSPSVTGEQEKGLIEMAT
jgi:hypothetical protein